MFFDETNIGVLVLELSAFHPFSNWAKVGVEGSKEDLVEEFVGL